MIWYEFTFEAPHPQDSRKCVRFVIEVPLPAASMLPKDAILESRIKWRSKDHG